MIGFFMTLIGLVITGAGIFGGGGGDAVVIGLVLGVPGAIWFWWELTGGPGARKNFKEKNVEYKGNGYAVLNHRVSNNSVALYVQADKDYNIKEHPAELVYTGATVGNVTVGGFHVNEAYRTESFGGKTGAYRIYLRRANGNECISTVRLQPDMVDSASKHPVVKQFLKGDKLELKHDVAVSIPENIRKVAIDYNMAGRYDLAAKLLRPYNKVRWLTQEDCEAVIAWMSDESGN